MGISFRASIFVPLTILLQLCLHNEVVAGDSVIRYNRKALETMSGGGSGGGDDAGLKKPPPLNPRIKQAYYAIQELKKKITIDPLGVLKTWDPKNQNVCNGYKGFVCDIVPDKKMEAVAAVEFNGFGFGGKDLTLSGFIEKLEDISAFHANSNNFAGSIPKEVANLRYFFELDLSNNKLSGQFPTEILGATKLTFLDLRFNSLFGAIPPQLFNLGVDVIFINNNKFGNQLPDNLGSTTAKVLTLANNHFTGPIPKSIGQASKTLTEVVFLNNQLTGCLPYEIGFLRQATVFDVSFNRLTGHIPDSFFGLANIHILNLARNKFYGKIPESVCKLTNLTKFNLSYNYFTQAGPECRKLINKRVLNVQMNCIADLPNQRPKAECAQFFSKPNHCPNVRKLTSYTPSSSKEDIYSGSLAKSDYQPNRIVSYDALNPHRS